jgi:excisionase family DNA binding protein
MGDSGMVAIASLTPVPLDDVLLRVSEFAQMAHVSRSYAYQLVQEKQIPHVRLGGCIRIPRNALLSYIEQHIEGGAGAK